MKKASTGFAGILQGTVAVNGRRVVVFEDTRALAAFVVSAWREICARSLNTVVNVALSGGKTPVDALRALARHKRSLPWERIHIFMVDERFVPHGNGDSNYGMVKRTLLDLVPIPRENVHPVETDLPGPAEAAKDYEEKLSLYFGLKPGHLPRFDLIMLGVGEDGHTASIFPGSPDRTGTEEMVRAVSLDGVPHDRITLTVPAINNGCHILMLARGESKAAILKRIVEGDDEALPASRIHPTEGDLLLLADTDAARSLAADSYIKG